MINNKMENKNLENSTLRWKENTAKINTTNTVVTDLYKKIPSLSNEVDIHTTSIDSDSKSKNNYSNDPIPLTKGVSRYKSQSTVDLVLTILAFSSMHYIYLGHLDFTSHRSVALFSALVFVSMALFIGGIYRTEKLRSLSQELTSITTCWLAAFACIGIFMYITKTGESISRIWLTSSMALCLGLLSTIRILHWLGVNATGNRKQLNVIVYGPLHDTKNVIEQLENDANSQINIIETIDYVPSMVACSENLTTLPTPDSTLCNIIEKHRSKNTPVDQVWITTSENLPDMVEKVSEFLVDSTVDLCVVPDRFTQRIIKGDVATHGNIDAVNVSEISLPVAAEQFKRVFDLVIGSAALLLLSLPMTIVALFVKFESKGPILFRQMRYGMDGSEIEVLKFRSMEVHDQNVIAQATKNDARVTRVGNFIRKTSLDELPQLLNVLQGSMSLIGPRPHAVAHNELWRQEIRGYMMRHKIKPGITGWAQVNGWRGETNTAFKMQQRVRYDLAYIKNWSPWLDLKIMMLTVAVGFVHKNAY